jgi:hypothetical protein
MHINKLVLYFAYIVCPLITKRKVQSGEELYHRVAVSLDEQCYCKTNRLA